MDTNNPKTDLIRKLIDARLTHSERKKVLEKAKEIIERDNLKNLSKST